MELQYYVPYTRNRIHWPEIHSYQHDSYQYENTDIWWILFEPSSNTFARFSHLLLLAQGDIAYMGELQGAASFFSFIDLPVPKNFNPCDHYIEQVALVPDDETQR